MPVSMAEMKLKLKLATKGSDELATAYCWACGLDPDRFDGPLRCLHSVRGWRWGTRSPAKPGRSASKEG